MSIEIVKDIEQWNVKDLVPYEKNMKVHDEKQIEKLANIFKEHGFDQPIVVDEKGVILKGHGRRLGAIKANMEKVPVIVRGDLTEAKKSAMRIADNMVARGDVDEDALFSELESLSADGDFDFGILALTDDEMGAFAESIDIEGLDDLLGGLDDSSDGEGLDADVETDEVPKERETPKEHDYEETYSVVVNCDDEDAQQEVYEKMMEEGYECKIQTL